MKRHTQREIKGETNTEGERQTESGETKGEITTQRERDTERDRDTERRDKEGEITTQRERDRH